MPALPPPSPESQLEFLSKLQRIFAEGDFTATYKYALLIALSDLAIELGSDNGSELMLSTRQIGERFISLYWKHGLPYSTGTADTSTGVLVQNQGVQAAVVSAICNFRTTHPVSSPQAASRLPSYQQLVSVVTNTVSAQPIKYLQNFGGGSDPFIFERVGAGRIRLKPGVAYCLRRFYPLIEQLARRHWIEHIKRNARNRSLLGNKDDLQAFLFEPSRQSLEVMAAGLRKLEGSKCFYCRGSLSTADVDHYIPFSLYPRDLAHNFVLAHPGCNRSKSDTLAALPHLERWLERLQKRCDMLAEIGEEAGFTTHLDVNYQVATWAYKNASTAQAKGWIKAREYELIDDRYAGYFESL